MILFNILSRLYSLLKAARKLLKFWLVLHIDFLKSWPKRINVKEGVFSVLDADSARSVDTLEPLVADSGHLQIDVLPLDFNSLESTRYQQIKLLSVLEVACVLLVLDVCRLHGVFDSSKVCLVVFGGCLRAETLFHWQAKA